MAKILVIDDDTLVTQLLDEFLKSEGHTVSVSHSGEQGFQSAMENTPDLILQDVMLPDATGFQMVDRFRGEPTTSTVPIIMMSGAARHPNQKQLGNMMGANDYVLKPFNIDDIDTRIKRLLTGGPLAPPPAQPEASNSPSAAPLLEWSSRPPTPEPQISQSPFQLRDWQKEPTPAAATAAAAPVVKIKLRSPSLWAAGFIFLTHLALSTYALLQEDQPLRLLLIGARSAATASAVLLGITVFTSGLFRIVMETRTALRLVGWAMIPIALKTLLHVAGAQTLLEMVPTIGFQGSPLDPFELTSILILGMMLRWQPGGSFKKSLFVVNSLVVLWVAIGHHLLQH